MEGIREVIGEVLKDDEGELSFEDIESIGEESEDMDFKDFDFEDLSENEIFELEKKHVKNLRFEAAILQDIVTKDTVTNYTYPSRKKFEVLAGYKIAKRKQRILKANLDNVKIYNLFFRFKNDWTNALNTTAMMYRRKGSEVILLMPDNTARKVIQETDYYLMNADRLVSEVKMSWRALREVEENLALLNSNERCAQSLLHEFGHILHWRLFDFYDLSEEEIYILFVESGYAENINNRSPEYHDMNTLKERLYLLKESLVEDYRIWLNSVERNGMFILPNVNTFYGDFIEPDLLWEGVEIMKTILNEVFENTLSKSSGKFSGEPSRILRAAEIVSKAESHNWYPGKHKMSKEDHLKILDQSKGNQPKNSEFAVYQ